MVCSGWPSVLADLLQARGDQPTSMRTCIRYTAPQTCLLDNRHVSLCKTQAYRDFIVPAVDEQDFFEPRGDCNGSIRTFVRYCGDRIGQR